MSTKNRPPVTTQKIGEQVLLLILSAGTVMVVANYPEGAEVRGPNRNGMAMGYTNDHWVQDHGRLFSFENGVLLDGADLLVPVAEEYSKFIDIIGGFRLPPGVPDSPYRTLYCPESAVGLVRELLALDLGPGLTWCAIAGALSRFSEDEYHLVPALARRMAEVHTLGGLEDSLTSDSPFSWYLPTWPLSPELAGDMDTNLYDRDGRDGLARRVGFLVGDGTMHNPRALDTDVAPDDRISLADVAPEKRALACSALVKMGREDWVQKRLEGLFGDAPRTVESVALMVNNLAANDPIEATEYLLHRMVEEGPLGAAEPVPADVLEGPLGDLAIVAQEMVDNLEGMEADRSMLYQTLAGMDHQSPNYRTDLQRVCAAAMDVANRSQRLLQGRPMGSMAERHLTGQELAGMHRAIIEVTGDDSPLGKVRFIIDAAYPLWRSYLDLAPEVFSWLVQGVDDIAKNSEEEADEVAKNFQSADLWDMLRDLDHTDIPLTLLIHLGGLVAPGESL